MTGTTPGVTTLFVTPQGRGVLMLSVTLAAMIGLPLLALLGWLVVAVALRASLGLAAAIFLLWAALAFLLTWFALSGRRRFAVTSAGIEVTSAFRVRRIPWEAVQRVQVGTWSPGAAFATEIVLKDGRVVRPAATSSSYALFRGDGMWAHGWDGRTPTPPTLAAIDAHRRWLGGQFPPTVGATWRTPPDDFWPRGRRLLR